MPMRKHRAERLVRLEDGAAAVADARDGDDSVVRGARVDVDDVLRSALPILTTLHRKYSSNAAVSKVPRMTLPGFLKFLGDAGLIDADFTTREAKQEEEASVDVLRAFPVDGVAQDDAVEQEPGDPLGPLGLPPHDEGEHEELECPKGFPVHVQ